MKTSRAICTLACPVLRGSVARVQSLGGLFRIVLVAAVAALELSVFAAKSDEGTKINGAQRMRGRAMLDRTHNAIADLYYDPHFGGIDLDALVKRAEAQIGEAKTYAQVFKAIAGVVRALPDGESLFLPPSSSYSFDYGWSMYPIGSVCVVTRVSRESDAEAKGLLRGDQVIAIEGTAVTPENSSTWNYLLQYIEPRHTLTITVASPGQPPRNLTIATRITDLLAKSDEKKPSTKKPEEKKPEKKTETPKPDDDAEFDRFFRVEADVLVWRQPSFRNDDKIVANALRRLPQHPKLVLDLRGCVGGNEETMLQVLAILLGRDMEIGAFRERKSLRPLTAKIGTHPPWNGRLLVLVDRDTYALPEIFAATLQQQNRALLLGDRTAGKVYELEYRRFILPGDVTHSGVIVASGKFEFPDGRELQGKGVTPDFLRLPRPTEIAERADPVLALALKQFGVVADPIELGKWANQTGD